MQAANQWREFIEKNGLPDMDESLLRQAFLHPSYVREQGLPGAASNQRLEFLGDAVLDLVMAEYLYSHYPEESEGKLTSRKAVLVRRTALADLADALKLGEMLLLGRGEEETGGRHKASLLGDALEALIGAIYLAQGWQAAQRFILEHFEELLQEETTTDSFDYKSQLQELIQSHTKQLPSYETVKTSGLPHQRTFETEVRLANQLLGRGEGLSKRAAEQEAAQQALTVQEQWAHLLETGEETERSGEQVG